MKLIEINQTNGPVISFTGRLKASVTSHQPGKERWTELQVYETDTDRIVAVSVGETVFPHEKRRCTAVVHDQLDDIVNSFAYSGLAQKLYNQLGLKPTVKV